jgi:hypothetical protein
VEPTIVVLDSCANRRRHAWLESNTTETAVMDKPEEEAELAGDHHGQLTNQQGQTRRRPPAGEYRGFFPVDALASASRVRRPADVVIKLG